MNAIEQLISVLCGPDGKCCITGSDEDRAIVDRALEALSQPPLPVQSDITALVEGMEVSIDVSTSEHDSGNRLFGTVTLAQENQGSKHGLILLVQDPQPNFKAQPPQDKNT